MPARSFHPRPVPVGANEGSVQRGWTADKAREANDLVRWAITERSRAICRGWSKVDPQVVNTLMVPLQQWVQRYPVPQRETLLLFWNEHQHRVRQVMPFTAAGRAKLERLAELMATI